MWKGLLPYLPNKKALRFVEKWIKDYPLQIKITRKRSSKLGDYRRPLPSTIHYISINHDLEPELFFLTLTHEIAHMHAFHKFRNTKIRPHGPEWKSIYGALIQESLEVYSADFQSILRPFSQNPKAGYFSDPKIVAYFSTKENKNVTFLNQLTIGDEFILENIHFKILEKKRTRYLCKNLSNNRNYLVKGAVAIHLK